jgi:hypothetical protein
MPRTWAQDNASIYITYPLQSQNAVGPLAAALIAGLVRQLLANPPGKRVLFAIDEMPTVGLPNLTGCLATVGGAGITMVLYAQALPQIEDVYGHEAALSILSNCTSQLFFPPREPHTAELISRSFGSRLGGHTTGDVRFNQLRQPIPARDGGRGSDVATRGQPYRLQPRAAAYHPRQPSDSTQLAAAHAQGVRHHRRRHD